MEGCGKAAEMLDAADKALDELRCDAIRWRFYSTKVAAILNIPLEQFEREIDGAIARQRKAGE